MNVEKPFQEPGIIKKKVSITSEDLGGDFSSAI